MVHLNLYYSLLNGHTYPFGALSNLDWTSYFPKVIIFFLHILYHPSLPICYNANPIPITRY